jgi:PUB domain
LKETASFPTVQMLLQNLIAYPDDEKYRKVNLSNERFKTKLATGPGYEVMLKAGFVLNDDCLCFPKDAPLTSAERILQLL